MITVRIHDYRNGSLAFDLGDLLDLLAPRSLEANWNISPVRLTDPNGCSWDEFMTVGTLGQLGQEPLDKLAANGWSISGATLSEAAHATRQVIWGQFVGRLPERSAEWVDIRAIDSTFYEVTTSDRTVHDAIRSAFQDVRLAPGPTTSTPIPRV